MSQEKTHSRLAFMRENTFFYLNDDSIPFF